MKKRLITQFIFLVILLLPVFSFGEDQAPSKNSLSLYVENDTTERKDRYYTSGIQWTWASQGLTEFFLEHSDVLINRLPYVDPETSKNIVTLSLGQRIYTPEDIYREDLIEDDRPYAGVSYLSLGIHTQNSHRLDTLELIVGVIGPHSYADTSQSLLHTWIGAHDPDGWDNQLEDELLLGIAYEQKRTVNRSAVNNYFHSDITAHFGGGLGNAKTYLNGGCEYRIGRYLPDNFRHYRIRPVSCSNVPYYSGSSEKASGRFGIFYFVSLDVQAVFRNILLDGNTFRDSHSVDKKAVVGDLMAGLAMVKDRYALSLAQVYRTKEFNKQDECQRYGLLNISFSY